MMYKYAGATRIVFELDEHFNNDPNIDEYDLIPFIENQENQDILVENHKLAINAEIIPAFYTFTYKLLLGLPRSSEKGSALVAGKALSYTRAVLLINPETTTAWNIRKELVVGKALSAKEDLQLTKLILGKHPKSPETWIHRRWLVTHLHLRVSSNQVDTAVISEEFIVCTMAAERYPSNYSAWSHRLWVLNNLAVDSIDEVLQNELLGNQTWINKHISDHSGLHYRGTLLQNQIQRCHRDWLGILLRETSMVAELIRCYPGHEALWYYRRRIIHLLFMNSGRMNNSLLESWAVRSGPTTVDQHLNTSKRLPNQRDIPNDTLLETAADGINSSEHLLEEKQSTQSGGSSGNSQRILFQIEDQFLRQFECDSEMNMHPFFLKYKRWFMNMNEHG